VEKVISTNYQKNKKSKVSLCNICLEEASLSWDHVPPKGGIKLTAVEQEPLLQYLRGSNDERKYKISQNGVKYRTLCSKCNAKLGSYYDISLNQFTLEIGKLLKSKIILPNKVDITTKPSHLVRSICGHLLAAKIKTEYTTIDVALRDFVFNESKQVPDNLKVFYWLYPYSSTINIRDVAMLKVRGDFSGVGMFSLLKYFPIAFLITDCDKYEGLRELTSYCYGNVDDEVQIPIDLRAPLKEYNWPEIVDEGNILLGGQSLHSGVFALPKGSKK